MGYGVKKVGNKLCQNTANNKSIAHVWLSYALASKLYCLCVFPFLPITLNLLRLLHWCPPLLGENKEDWTGHLHSGALMESLRLKWQEVKGESAENSRQLHTATLLSLCQTTQLWWYGKSVCVSLFMCVKMRRGRQRSKRCVSRQ